MFFTVNDRPATADEIAMMIIILIWKAFIFVIAFFITMGIANLLGLEKVLAMYIAYRIAADFKVTFSKSKENKEKSNV